jgi:5-methylcytosine-specific restriction enzyme subunit McrC
VHHPRTEDTLLNRVLLAGLNRASALANEPELKSHVRRLSKMLGATVTAQALDAPMVAAAWGAMDRRTTAYRAALTLIDLLLEGEGVALDDQGSRIRLKGFLFDMNRFFQSLISRLLREHLTDVVVHDEFRLKGMFSYLSGQNPLARRGPTLRPDFVLMRHGQVLSVLDAKYRDLWEQTLPRDMLYQLALYALGRSAGERSSVILFPTVDAAAREQTIVIREPVLGATQASVTMRPVNLLELERLLRSGRDMQSRRAELTWRLVFGQFALREESLSA